VDSIGAALRQEQEMLNEVVGPLPDARSADFRDRILFPLLTSWSTEFNPQRHSAQERELFVIAWALRRWRQYVEESPIIGLNRS
jgi:hypothetical protein